MALVQDAPPTPAAADSGPRCPVDHSPPSCQKSGRAGGSDGPALNCDAHGVWHARGFAEARAILRSDATRQAGFAADRVTANNRLTREPILYQQGKAHQEQRTQTARFFTPKTVSTSYRQLMETLADEIVAEVRRRQRVDLSQLSMRLAVQVAGQVVGLTNSPLAGMARRLDAFFAQPKPSRWAVVNGIQQLWNLRRILSFYRRDVRPAIRARREQPGEDVISHLLARGYNDREILTECVTYAAAGMATTREFICMAAWHFLEHPGLRARYLVAPEAERVAMLHEVLRVEPVVGHLFRRATADIEIESEGRPVRIPAGALIDIHIDAANLDPSVVGPEPRAVCPGRPLHADRVGAMLLSFGDGPHRCPGAYVAIQETDILLQRLMAVEGLHIAGGPVLTWNDLTQGYELRHFILARDAAA